MSQNSIPTPTLEQERTDLEMAERELCSARKIYAKVLENAKKHSPSQLHNDVSVFYSNLQVQSAEELLNRLIKYYNDLHAANDSSANVAATAPSNAVNTGPPINIGPVVEIEDSDDEQTNDRRNSSPGPAPEYSSWPPTPPHFYAALAEDHQVAAPSTPARRPQDARQPSLLPSTPPCAQPRQTTPASPASPAMPRHVTAPSTTIVGEDGFLTSPNPKKKHYIVTKGRRTGIYSAWPVAHGYIDGIVSAAWQSFDTYWEAFDAYMGAREQGLLSIIRLPGDTVEQYGPVDSAEDL